MGSATQLFALSVPSSRLCRHQTGNYGDTSRLVFYSTTPRSWLSPLPVVTLPVKIWDENATYDYIVKRMKLHQTALVNDCIPPCSDNERWARPTLFAVKKRVENALYASFPTLMRHNSSWVRPRNTPGSKTWCQHSLRTLL